MSVRDDNSTKDVEIDTPQDVTLVARVVSHPEFRFDPTIHGNLPNQLYRIFRDEVPCAATEGGHWPGRARLRAAKVIARMASLNAEMRLKQHEHL